MLRSGLLLCCALWTMAVHAVDSLPAFEQVRAGHVATDSILLDRQGVLIGTASFARDERRLDWVPLSTLSPAMREALLAAEDRRFFEHSGVDWRAFAGAAWQNLWNRRQRGASTLTMQLAGLLDPALRLPPRARRSLAQKWDQTLAARDMEARWSKEQILEAYLNLAPFRGRLQGIGAASMLLFGLPPERLTRREAVILAALLRGPNAAPEVVSRRACQLASTLKDAAQCAAIQQLARARLAGAMPPVAPQLARTLLQEGGQRLRSTLDAGLQQRLRNALDPRLRGVSVLVLDARGGEVLAWLSEPQGADGVRQRRSLVEAAWPFAIARGVQDRIVHGASLLPDEAGTSWISLRSAVAQRREGVLAALRSGRDRDQLGERLRQLGLDARLTGDPSSGEPPGELELYATLPQLAAAWGTLIEGLHHAPRVLIGDAPPARRVWSADTVFIANDVLASGGGLRNWRRVSHPTAAGPGVVVLGHDGRHVIALAVDGDGARRDEAVQLWERVVQAMPAGAPLEVAVPPGVVTGAVFFEPPVEPPRREWFLRGGEVSRSIAGAVAEARILFPQSWQYPRPPAGEVWTFEANRAGRWVLDGTPFGQGQQLRWTPQPGRHVLQLLGQAGDIQTSVVFEVLSN